MADVSIGTARGVVRIDYESRGAARVSQEFERIKSQTEGTATSFATWANKIGMGSQELQRLNQIQRAVVEAQKTAQYFALQQANVHRSGNAGLAEQLRLMRLAHQSQKSLADISKVSVEATKRLPSEMARAGSTSAKAFSDAFAANAIAGVQQRSGGLSSALSSVLAFGMKSALGVALAGTAAAVAGLGMALTGGFNRLTGIDTATHKLQALGMSAKEVGAVVEDTKKAVDKTQYSLDQAINVAAGAVQAGIKPGNDLQAYLKDVQGLAAVTGMDLQTVGMIMNRVQTSGRVLGDDLRELEYVGVNVMPMLQKEYGKSAAELTKMRENGEIDAKHFRDAISHNFGNAAAIMGNSITSAIGNAKTAISKVGASLLAPLFAASQGGEGPSGIVVVINKIREAADNLRGWFEQHQKGLVTFWWVLGKAAIIGAGALLGAITVIVGGFGYLVKAASWVPRALAPIFEFFGGEGIAKNLRTAADAITGFGDNVIDTAKKLGGLSDQLEKGWKNLDQWRDSAQAAVGAEKTFSESAKEVAPGLITVIDALGKLGVTNDDATKAIEGTEEEWRKFLKSLQAKGAAQDVIDAMKNLRYNFEHGGRAAIAYSKALKQMGDSSVDASTKANNLIKALKDLRRLPGEAGDALSKYNEDVDAATEFNNKLVDVLDVTGNALIRQNGQIDTNSKNGRTLKSTIEGIRDDAYALAATGEYAPAEIWQRTHDALMAIANQFGITGDAAEKFIATYLLPEKDFEVQFLSAGKDDVQRDLEGVSQALDQAKKEGKDKFTVGITAQDPNVVKQILESMGLQWTQYDELTKTAVIQVPTGTDIEATRKRIEALFNASPSELESQIKVITTAEDVVKQINDGNPLKIPAVLDFTASKPVEPNDMPVGPFGSPTPVYTPERPKPKTKTEIPQGLPVNPTEIMPVPGADGNQTTSPDVPSIAPMDQPDGMSSLLNEKRVELTRKLLAPNPILEQGAEKQGQNFGDSFAQGIRDSIPNVLQAALELATASTDPLGHSPAKIGPLAGSGWTYFRGRTYSEAYAEGIASGQEAVGGAALSVAGASTDPLTDSFAKMMRDASAWVSLGRHIFDLVSTMTDITFNVLNLGQQISGGRLFPKTYIKDPSAKGKSGSILPPWNPSSVAKPPGPQTFSPPSATASAVTPNQPNASIAPGTIKDGSNKQEIANYIMNKAQSLGYSRKQAEDFVVQAMGESGLNPNANGGNQNGTGDVLGIFQFTPDTWGNRAGKPTDAKANIDAYFELAQQRGLTPENFLSGTQLGTQVSKGGPWHPENAAKGHLSTAQKNARQYLDAYKPTQGGIDTAPSQTPSGAPTFIPGVGWAPPGYSWDSNERKWVKEAAGSKPSGGSQQPLPGTQKFGPAPATAIKPGIGSRASTFGGNKADYTKEFLQSRGIKPLYTPGEYQYGENNGLPQWVQDFAKQFGLQVSSSVSASGASSLHGAGLGFDFTGPRENMTKMAEYIQQNLSDQTLQLIYADSKTNRKYGIAGGQPAGPGTDAPGYYQDAWKDHYGHVHWGTDVPVGGGYPGMTPAQRTSDNKPVPVTLGPDSIDPQANTTPFSPLPDNPLGLPPGMADLAKNDPILQQAFESTRGVGTQLQDVNGTLQHLDSVIMDQQTLNTDTSKANIEVLNATKDSIMQSQGMKEGPNPLEATQTIVQNVAGIVGDAFGIVDSSLASIESTKEIGDTLVRGIANTEDIYKIIDNIQSFIDLGKNIAATTGDVLGLAGTITGMAAAGDPSGGTAGAAMALGAASSIAGIVSQVYAGINAWIDLGQEVYNLATTYIGRGLEQWFGLTGASDIKYLLDEMNGQLQVYSSENPQMKSTFNTWYREMGNPTPGRAAPTNNLYIYQGPGQDPRDTMNDAMFAVRSSGMGVFGYAS